MVCQVFIVVCVEVFVVVYVFEFFVVVGWITWLTLLIIFISILICIILFNSILHHYLLLGHLMRIILMHFNASIVQGIFCLSRVYLLWILIWNLSLCHHSIILKHRLIIFAAGIDALDYVAVYAWLLAYLSRVHALYKWYICPWVNFLLIIQILLLLNMKVLWILSHVALVWYYFHVHFGLRITLGMIWIDLFATNVIMCLHAFTCCLFLIGVWNLMPLSLHWAEHVSATSRIITWHNLVL